MIVLSVFTLWVFMISFAPPNTVLNNKYNAYLITSCLFLYVCYSLGTYINLSPDMNTYFNQYVGYKNVSLFTALDTSTKEPMFTAFQWFVSRFSTNKAPFYIAIWCVFASTLLFALSKIFKPWQILLVFFSYLNYFIFFNYVTNVVRQGFALSFLMVAISVLVSGQKKNKLFYFSIIFAPLFHYTALPLSIVLFLLKKVNFTVKTTVIVWCISALLFVTHFNQKIFGVLSSFIPYIRSYSSSGTLLRYTGGTNRLDFLAFSAFGLIIAYIIYRRWMKDNIPYEYLLKIYALFNVYFLLMGFVAYSDRIAAYSWFILPLLIWYPILKRNKYQSTLIILALLIFIGLAVFNGSFLYR